MSKLLPCHRFTLPSAWLHRPGRQHWKGQAMDFQPPHRPSIALLQHLHEDASYSSALFLPPPDNLKPYHQPCLSISPFITRGDNHCVFPCRLMTNSLFPAEISVFVTGFLCKAIEGRPRMSVSPEQAALACFHHLPICGRGICHSMAEGHMLCQPRAKALTKTETSHLLGLQFLVRPQLQSQALQRSTDS